MTKEKSVSLSKNLDAVRKLESSKFVFRSQQNALESDDSIAYEWFEDNVIQKRASVSFGVDTNGKDTATIRMINPKTNKEEIVYFTTDKNEIASLKIISEGKPLIIEPQK